MLFEFKLHASYFAFVLFTDTLQRRNIGYPVLIPSIYKTALYRPLCRQYHMSSNFFSMKTFVDFITVTMEIFVEHVKCSEKNCNKTE